MQKKSRFSVFDSNIINDIFGEEVVLVNLQSGIYYSLRFSSAQIWKRIVSQYSIEEIIFDLMLIYNVDENILHTEIEKFVSILIENKIIKEVAITEKIIIDNSLILEKIEFEAPIIEIFSDMQEILLLDPVHDVDKAGWPISNVPKTSTDSLP